MEMPIKPERPAIFRTPVKLLTREDIASLPQVERDHENAVKAYHKALEAYYSGVERQDDQHSYERDRQVG